VAASKSVVVPSSRQMIEPFCSPVNAAIGTTYLPADRARAGTKIEIDVRGKKVTAEVVKLPFVPHRTKR